MKIFAIGDTLWNFERFRPEYFPEGQELTKEDVVLQLGDFGGVWFGDERDDEALDWLKGLPFTVAFVSGNHENYDALVKYPIENWHGGRVQPVRPHVLHLMRGQVFELAGHTFFTMGGAASHDIEDGILSLDDPGFERKYLTLKQKEHTRFRIEHLSWWREELPSEEEYAEARKNLDAYGWAVDYILTHCAPTGIALQLSWHNVADHLTDFLQEVKDRAQYHYWLFGHYHDNAAFSFAAFRLRQYVGKDKKMNKRKLVDYTSMYEALATLMKTELPEVELYFAIGWAVCARPEKGAAVMAAEHLQASCPESKGFSPRNLRRMREFYRAYADSRELQALALKLGWTQNVAILEGCEGSQERAWYLRAALEHRWTKTELMEQIQAGAWLQEGLDELGNTCYTESNTVSAGCLEHEKDPFYVSRQYGGGVSDRLGGHQPGGDRQPSLPSSPAEAGGARHLLRRSRRPTAPQPRLRGIRPAHWDGQGQPPQHVPHLRRRLQRQDAPPDGICRPPGAGGGRSLVHRRLRRHLAGCAGGVSGAAGSNHYTRRVSPWRQRSL